MSARMFAPRLMLILTCLTLYVQVVTFGSVLNVSLLSQVAPYVREALCVRDAPYVREAPYVWGTSGAPYVRDAPYVREALYVQEGCLGGISMSKIPTCTNLSFHP